MVDIGAINKRLENKFAFLICLSLVVGILGSKLLNNFKSLVTYMIIINMFTLALGCKTTDFSEVIRSPGKVILTIFNIYCVSPLLALAIGNALFPREPEFASGLVLISVLPVATSSAFWTDLTKGDLPFTLSIIAISTLLSGVVVPGGMSIFVGNLIEVDSKGLIMTLLATVVIPVIAGIFLRNKLEKQIVKIKPWLDTLVRINMLLILAINAAVIRPLIQEIGDRIGLIVISVTTQIFASYLMGHIVSSHLFRNEKNKRISVAYVSGMRNNGAGIAIALAYFTPLVAVPVILSILLQQPIATLYKRLIESKEDNRINGNPTVGILNFVLTFKRGR